MEINLIDGTYELFRHFCALPSAKDSEGREVAAVRGVVTSLLGMMQAGTTYIGVATDHVIESFRNNMWPGYKTGQDVDPALLSQFSLLEEVLRALGVVVWAMEEYEADDALASAAFLAGQDRRVKRVVISTPDKDLSQCVQGTRIVQFDRRRRIERDRDGVVQKFGVEPGSIPDYLALVGDAADGYPGLPGWGAKSAAALLQKFGKLEVIPANAMDWHVNVSNAQSLSRTLNDKLDLAFLFRDIATLRSNLPLFPSVDELLWRGPTAAFTPLAERLQKAVFAKTESKSRKAKTPGK
jgi:5'-3' exonuclease